MNYSKVNINFEPVNWTNVDNFFTETFDPEMEKMQDALSALSAENMISHIYTAHEDWTVSAEEAKYFIIKISGQDAAAKMYLPAVNGLYIVYNNYYYNITVDVEGGTSPEVLEYRDVKLFHTTPTYIKTLLMTKGGLHYPKILGTSVSLHTYGIHGRLPVSSSSGLDITNYDAFRINSSGGALALTLGNDAENVSGRVITLYMDTAGNNAVLTPSSFADGSTLTFDAVGESATLRWNGDAWEVIALSGATIGA